MVDWSKPNRMRYFYGGSLKLLSHSFQVERDDASDSTSVGSMTLPMKVKFRNFSLSLAPSGAKDESRHCLTYAASLILNSHFPKLIQIMPNARDN